MKNIKALLLILVALAIVSACSDDPTPVQPTPATKDNAYFPTTLNSWWEYDTFDVDTSGSIIVSTKLYLKTVITDSIQKFGKTGFVFANKDGNGTTSSLDTLACDSYSIYSLPSFITPQMDIPLPFSFSYTQWYTIANSQGTTWEINKQTIPGDSINIPPYGLIKYNGTLTVTCKKGVIKEIIYGTNNELKGSAQEYQMLYEFSGEGTTLLFGKTPFRFSATNHLWLLKDIGIVKSLLDPFSVIATVYGQDMPIKDIQGRAKILTKYNIAK